MSKPKARSDLTPLQHMLSAGTGSILTTLIVTPFDVTKTRLQSASTCTTCFASLSLPNLIAFCPCPSAARAGTVETMARIAQTEGLRTLWKGLCPALAMQVPATVVYFSGYEKVKGELDRRWSVRYSPLIAGAVARTIAVTIISPLELLRTRMQSTQSMGVGLRQSVASLRSLARTQGARFLWRGLSPTLWRDVPFSAVYWTLYERFKGDPACKQKHVQSTFARSFFAGALSGMVAAFVTTPFDVVKTRRQVVKNRTSEPVLLSLLNVATNEGREGLFRGVAPRIAKVVPACAVMMSSYEVGKAVFRTRNMASGR